MDSEKRKPSAKKQENKKSKKHFKWGVFCLCFWGEGGRIIYMQKKIERKIKELVLIVKSLNELYPNKKFTLDGRLVGDLGEVLAEQEYCINLNKGLTKHHDAISYDGKNVQIKTTMKNTLTFPADHIPDYYLGIHLSEQGKIIEIYNGPAKPIAEYIKNRKQPKNNLHNVSFNTLNMLNKQIDNNNKIKRK